jgi:hypothetical protein
MTHKSSHVIVSNLLGTPGVTSQQKARLLEIQERDQYTWADRMYLGWLTFTLSG